MRKLIKKILKYLGLNQKDSRIENKRLMKILTKNEFSNKYYIIRRTPLGAGLYSNFHYVLTHIIYALKNKYIPVVDMQNYKTYFNEDYPIEFISGGGGTLNAWEYYFNQPTQHSLEEAYKSKKEIILAEMHYKSDEIDILDLKNIHLSNSIINKYLSFNKTTLEKINISKKELFKNKKNILGVKVRRSDYLLKPHLHCVVPEIDDILSKVKIFLKEWNMEYVYLSTEELQIVELFRDIFKEKLIVTNCPRIDKYNLVEGKCSSALKFNRANDNYLRGLEYIIDTVLLSYCDALIAPKVNGSIVALEYNNNRYKYKYIYDLGKY